MKKAKKRNWYEEQKERREREQREKEAREQRRKAAQRRRAEQAGTGNGYAGVEKKTAEPWKNTAGTGKNQTDVAAEGVLPQGKRIRAEAAPTWVNTAGPGGGAELWKQVKLEPGETAADYYEKKRKQREADRKETDAAFSRALEETQKELREQRLGVAEGFGRKKRYNRNYEDLFGLPEGGDFRSRVEGTRGWDKLNGSEQYDRMVYIQEELERRKKEREKEEEIGYNTINGRNKQPDVWNGQRPSRTMELITEKPQGGAGRETADAVWSGPAIVRRPEEIPEDVWNGLDWRGRLSAAGRIEGAKQREAWIAGEREAANQPTTGRAGAELLMADVNEEQANGLNKTNFQTSGLRQANPAVQTVSASGVWTELPEVFDSYDDLKKLAPDGVLAGLMSAGLTEDAWNSMAPEEQEAVLAPWVEGGPGREDLSPGAQEVVTKIENTMMEIMNDEEKRGQVLGGLGTAANVAGVMGALGGPLTDAASQKAAERIVQEALKGTEFDGELSPEQLRDISQGINAFFDIRVDEDGVWHSTGNGIAHRKGGYAPVMDDVAENILGFDLNSGTVDFTVTNEKGEEQAYQLRGWSGSYGDLLGGEFGIYEKNSDGEWVESSDDRFNVELTLEDKDGHKLFSYGQEDAKFWQYAAMHPEDMPELMVQEGYAKNEEEARAIVDKLNAGDVVVRGRIIGNGDTDESYLRAMEDGIRAQNAEKAKGAFWSPLGYMMTEAEQIKTSGRGHTDDGRPYIDVSLNSPWYRGGN